LTQGNIGHHFFGHDHCDDFQGSYKGVQFHFGRKTGFGGYNCQLLKQGARVISISETPDSDPPKYSLTSHIMTYDLKIENPTQPIYANEPMCSDSNDWAGSQKWGGMTWPICIAVIAIGGIVFLAGIIYTVNKCCCQGSKKLGPPRGGVRSGAGTRGGYEQVLDALP
jgi:hypothetical protein